MQDFCFVLIDKAETIQDLNKKEASWMQLSKSMQPNGLNNRKENSANNN
jgi:hypothetical protein